MVRRYLVRVWEKVKRCLEEREKPVSKATKKGQRALTTNPDIVSIEVMSQGKNEKLVMDLERALTFEIET